MLSVVSNTRLNFDLLDGKTNRLLIKAILYTIDNLVLPRAGAFRCAINRVAYSPSLLPQCM